MLARVVDLWLAAGSSPGWSCGPECPCSPPHGHSTCSGLLAVGGWGPRRSIPGSKRHPPPHTPHLLMSQSQSPSHARALSQQGRTLHKGVKTRSVVLWGLKVGGLPHIHLMRMSRLMKPLGRKLLAQWLSKQTPSLKKQRCAFTTLDRVGPPTAPPALPTALAEARGPQGLFSAHGLPLSPHLSVCYRSHAAWAWLPEFQSVPSASVCTSSL